jgi:hypothetical protein
MLAAEMLEETTYEDLKNSLHNMCCEFNGKRYKALGFEFCNTSKIFKGQVIGIVIEDI